MKNKKIVILVICILLLAAYLRLYKISEYMTFLGDEGRDVLVAKGILAGKFTLLGPRSSAGDFFMGPAYYYMITPFLWLFDYDPVGPAVMVGLVGVATVYLIFIVGKKFFDTRAGLFAAALYAVSPLVLAYSHSSWNPDVLPFFALLMLYMLYLSFESTKPWRYLLLSGFLLGICLQLHYLSLFLAIISVLYMLLVAFKKDKKIQVLVLLKQYAQFFGGFLLGFSPFIAFEVRHDFENTRAIYSFIFSDTLTHQASVGGSYFQIVVTSFFRIFARLLFDFPTTLTHIPQVTLYVWGSIAMIVTAFSLVSLVRTKNKFVVWLLAMWLFLSVLFLGFYKKAIYDYLFTFMFPLPFLLIGNLLSQLYTATKTRWIGIGGSILLFSGIFLFLLSDQPFKSPPNRQRDQAKTIAEAVIALTDNKPYNFALISGGNSDYAYRYYLQILGHEPVQIDNIINDPQRKTVTDQLLVVCEQLPCHPLGHPLFDVASFGRAQIVKEENVSVVQVYKLIHYQQ